MLHPSSPPAIELFHRDSLIASDRNKADLAALDKRTDEVHARAESFSCLALGEQKLQDEPSAAAAIQKALDACPSKGAIIWFPRGTYRVTKTLRIPAVAKGVIKPVRLEGENASALDGMVDGWAGGASSIRYDGDGTCLDAFSANSRSNALTPSWSGSLRNLAIHKDGPGDIGFRANAILNATFENVAIRGFPKNLLMQGEYFYATFDRLRSYRGQADFNHTSSGSGPKANGATFRRCCFSEYEGQGGAFSTGVLGWPGQFIKFQDTWFENSPNGSVFVGNANQVVFDNCYFEDNAKAMRTHVFYESLGGSAGSVIFDTCYARITAPGGALCEIKAGDSKSDCRASLTNTLIVGEGSNVVALRKASSFPAPIGIISINNMTSRNGAALFSGDPSDVAELFTRVCSMSKDWSKVGRLNNG